MKIYLNYVLYKGNEKLDDRIDDGKCHLLDGWVSSPRLRSVQVMSMFPTTAVIQMRAKLADSATTVHSMRSARSNACTAVPSGSTVVVVVVAIVVAASVVRLLKLPSNT